MSLYAMNKMLIFSLDFCERISNLLFSFVFLCVESIFLMHKRGFTVEIECYSWLFMLCCDFLYTDCFSLLSHTRYDGIMFHIFYFLIKFHCDPYIFFLLLSSNISTNGFSTLFCRLCICIAVLAHFC